MAQTDNHLVIMAGGVGGRFWPMSTADCPKQFIDVLGVGRSLIQLTYDRFAGVVPSDNVWVVTNQKYVSLVHEQLPEIPLNHILSEPCRRNTAPCIAYVSWRIKKENPKANIVKINLLFSFLDCFFCNATLTHQMEEVVCIHVAGTTVRVMDNHNLLTT